MTRTKLIRLLACLLLCALSLLLPACTTPEVPDGEAGGGGEVPAAPNVRNKSAKRKPFKKISVTVCTAFCTASAVVSII